MAAGNACLACRRVKMRCFPSQHETSRCQRCVRKSIECIFRAHRRGRKPGSRAPRTSGTASITMEETLGPQAFGSRQEHHPLRAISGSNTNEDTVTDLQPSGVLSREAMRGKFSMRHVLNAGESDEQITALETHINHSDDPIVLGLLNVPLAKSLFQSFMLVLNPYISQLDPQLHTFTYVRDKSVFLLTAILAVTAKSFHPSSYRQFYNHSQDLSMMAFRKGTKNTETIQAMLILTYWKEPYDDRVFSTVGYAIRLCIDLGWHKFEAAHSKRQTSRSEIEQREDRNIERTWLVLFVYDRSISMQTGKPYMIECDSFIESITTWSQHPLAIDNDRLLGSLVTLRLITSTDFKLISHDPQRGSNTIRGTLSPILSVLNRRIDNWERKWARASDSNSDDGVDTCHNFMIHFYGRHLKLQLSSLQVQPVLSLEASSGTDLRDLWTAYSSALDMLQMIPQYQNYLSFAQDSVHVMLAYSAAFLVKILLLSPQTIAEQLEPGFVKAIRDAAFTFARLAGPSSQSCRLQTKFLQRIIWKLESRSEQPFESSPTTRAEQPSYVMNQEVQESPPCSVSECELPAYDVAGWDDIFTSVGLDPTVNVFLS